ncbi:MAG: transcription factor S [Nitrosopumilus sp.]|nr:transcription factor S [Nitrosopumilus sp.]MCE2505254.1 transcription factor S [Nitrosopumilaceae archaeon]
MKFCPKCEVKLKKGTSGLQCSKCGYAEGQEEKQTKKITKNEEHEESILAFEGNEGEESHPTIKIECEKCGHDEAIWWMLQTRSADEPTTQFYRCTKCKNTWRNYA